MTNKGKRRFTSILACAMMVVGTLIGMTNAAYGAATDEGGAHGGSCKGTDGQTRWDTCFGATWVQYPVNGDNNIVIPTKYRSDGSVSVAGGTLSGCVDDGADTYYRLGLNKYVYHSNASLNSPIAEQVGLIQASQIKDNGGYVTFATNAMGVWGGRAIDMSTAKQYFDLTKKANMNAGLEWPNVSAFCWSTKLLDCPTTDPNYPTCVPPIVIPEYDALFWADSTIEVSPQGDVPQIGAYTSEKADKTTYITFSTDQDSVVVKFHHNLHYEVDKKTTPEHGSGSWSGSDTFTEAIYTDWETSGASTSSGQYSLTGTEPKSNHDSEDLATNSYTVSGLTPGETRRVCQRIKYTPKYYKFKTVADHDTTTNLTNADGTPQLNEDGSQATSTTHNYWDWGVDTSSGSAYSEACAIIYRPIDSDNHPYNPGEAGKADSNIMYAGEDTEMYWETFGETADTRRLTNWKSILFLVKENVGYNSSNTTGNNRSSSDPCAYYNGKVSTYYCNDYESGSVSHPNSHSYQTEPNFAVADYVGAKFCLSFGYRYEYWYGHSTDYTGSFEWYGPYTPYWRDYNASCRTIAKKPSSAVWNGSLMTPAGVYTPLAAPRHTSDAMNSTWKKSSDLSEYKLYGSWSEHLDVIGGAVNNHGSGSKMYSGGKVGICNDVDLTIANVNCSGHGTGLGGSGIENNNAYLNKLITYLRDDPKIQGSYTYIKDQTSDSVMSQLHEGMAGTTIVRHNGTLNITHNITTNNGPYSNIYELPQVIIFVNGDVNISSSVERIDAWLIVSGTINTCNNFASGSTPAFVNLLHSANNPPACSKQLVFNGPVRAKNLVLMRSFGADRINKNLTGSPLPNRMNSDRQIPAEVFNLRADTYLWAYAQAGRYDSSYTESYSRELPPRY